MNGCGLAGFRVKLNDRPIPSNGHAAAGARTKKLGPGAHRVFLHGRQRGVYNHPTTINQSTSQSVRPQLSKQIHPFVETHSPAEKLGRATGVRWKLRHSQCSVFSLYNQ